MTEYFKEDGFALFQGDCNQILKQLPENSVDLIFTDPPYFLSEKKDNQKSDLFPKKEVWNYKGDWDVSKGTEQDYYFHLAWIEETKRVRYNLDQWNSP
jgi:site-specific DNA-methyltransferase (adenine-specific)